MLELSKQQFENVNDFLNTSAILIKEDFAIPTNPVSELIYDLESFSTNSEKDISDYQDEINNQIDKIKNNIEPEECTKLFDKIKEDQKTFIDGKENVEGIDTKDTNRLDDDWDDYFKSFTIGKNIKAEYKYKTYYSSMTYTFTCDTAHLYVFMYATFMLEASRKHLNLLNEFLYSNENRIEKDFTTPNKLLTDVYDFDHIKAFAESKEKSVITYQKRIENKLKEIRRKSKVGKEPIKKVKEFIKVRQKIIVAQETILYGKGNGRAIDTHELYDHHWDDYFTTSPLYEKIVLKLIYH